MGKTIKSITLDIQIAKDGMEQAIKERRSFSSLIEYLISTYLINLNKLNEYNKKEI